MLTTRYSKFGFRHIRNARELLSGRPSRERRARLSTLLALDAGLEMAQPSALLRGRIRLDGSKLRIWDDQVDLRKFREVVLLGAGKAAFKMAEYMLGLLGDRVSRGLIIVPAYQELEHRLGVVDILRAGHPIPDERGVNAASSLLSLARDCSKDTLVIVMISGGASSLMVMPAEGVTLQGKVALTRMMLKAGANIHELNTVRKHLSAVKGGQLAVALRRTHTLALLLSDVVGDPIDVIGSGPTAPDPTTFRDAMNVLDKYGLTTQAPPDVLARLERGVRGEVEETPKPKDPVFRRVRNVLVGGVGDACSAASHALRRQGFNVMVLTQHLEGEAREVAKVVSAVARDIARCGSPLRRPAAIVMGGETSVTVRGGGIGGRNQEMTLAMVKSLGHMPYTVFASIGTDGIDGYTEAAGAICDSRTLLEAEREGIDPAAYLKENNSHEFFKRVGGLVMTGPTGTNVGDLAVLCIP